MAEVWRDGEPVPNEVVRQIFFDLKPYAVSCGIPVQMLETAKIEAWREEVKRTWMFQLRGFLATRTLDSARVVVHAKAHAHARVRYPKTWWDAFRLRFFPAWMLERWHPQYEVVEADDTDEKMDSVTLSVQATYPDMVIPPLKPPIVWLMKDGQPLRKE